jgi:hypothetical protein
MRLALLLLKRSMRALLALVLLVPSLAFADGQNVYDFVFIGTIYPDIPFGSTPPEFCGPCESFTVTFLANSPTLPFPGVNQPFSASLSAYDVNVVIGNQIVLQNGTGSFGFDGADQLGYSPGDGATYIGGGWSFESPALEWGGTPDFGVQFPDPLNGAGYVADDGVAGCSLPGNDSGPVLCSVGGRSELVLPVSAPEPETLALLALGLAGIGFMSRRNKKLTATQD